MNPIREVTFADFLPEFADELVAMWRASFEQGVGIEDPHPINEQRDFLFNKVLPNYAVRVALSDGKIVGFIAASTEFVAQLYVHVDYQRQGIGSKLLDWAKKESNGRLELFTFECNKRAKQFYESKGFKIIARGFEPEWQQDDIKYEWLRKHACP